MSAQPALLLQACLVPVCDAQFRSGPTCSNGTAHRACSQGRMCVCCPALQMMCSYLTTSSAWPVLLVHWEVIVLAIHLVLAVNSQGGASLFSSCQTLLPSH